MTIATYERPMEKIAQFIWIPGKFASWRMPLFLISSSFLLNHEPIVEVLVGEEWSWKRCWHWKRWEENVGFGEMAMLFYDRV